MVELKTKQQDSDVDEFLHEYTDDQQKIDDSLTLIDLMESVTGEPAKKWKDSMIGFGKYHYKSMHSKQEGDWFLVGFSPRKKAISLYVYMGLKQQQPLLKTLGKYTMGKSCLYVKRLADIDLAILRKMIETTVDALKEKYTDNI